MKNHLNNMKKNVLFITPFLTVLVVISLFIFATHKIYAIADISSDYTNNYTIDDFQLARGVDSATNKQVVAATTYLSIVATSTDIPFYKNGIIVKTKQGVVGNTKITGGSSNLVDMGTYYNIPASTTAQVKLLSVFDPSAFSSGSYNLTLGIPSHEPVLATSTPVTTANTYVPHAPYSTSNGSPVCGGQTYMSEGVDIAIAKISTVNLFRSPTVDGSYTLIKSGMHIWIPSEAGKTFYSYADNPGKGTFYYKVSVLNASGESVLSAATPAVGTAPCTPPAPIVTPSSTCGINVSWIKDTVADSYNVYRSTTLNGIYKQVANNVSDSSFTDIYDLVSGGKPKTYFYKISDTNSGGTSNQGLAASGSASNTSCQSASDITVGVGSSYFLGDSLPITWTASSRTANIKVELYKAGILVKTISSSLSALKKGMNYVLPVTLVPGADYSIKVSDKVNSGISATSPMFEIKKGVITLDLSPSTVVPGQLITFTWTNTGNLKSFNVSVVSDTTGKVVVSKSVTATTKTYTWKTTTKTVGKYKFTVADHYDVKNVVSTQLFEVTSTPTITPVVPATSTVSVGTSQEVKTPFFKSLLGNVWSAVSGWFR